MTDISQDGHTNNSKKIFNNQEIDSIVHRSSPPSRSARTGRRNSKAVITNYSQEEVS